MPGILKKYFLLFSLLLTAGGVAFAFLAKISAPQPKIEFIPSIFASKGLGDKMLQVKIRFDEVKTDAEAAEITAEISLPFEFNEKLNFRWKTGPGVVPEEGLLSGTLEGLKAQEIKILRLKVKGFSKQQNHHIAFEIYGAKNGRKIYGDALIASDIENTFENTVQNVERIRSSQ